MAFLAPIHRPSSVRHALKLNFLSPEEECLIVAKANRLEIYQQTLEGLLLRHSKALYGKVDFLEKFRPASSETDHLFVGTDRFMYFSLSWDPISEQFKTEKSFVDQSEKTGRDSQALDRSFIDPSGRFLTLDLFEGIFTLIPFLQKRQKVPESLVGTLGDPISIRIPELFIRSWAYVWPQKDLEKAKPKIAMIYQDNAGRLRLKVKRLDYFPASNSEPGSADFLEDEEEEEQKAVDQTATHIIPVPPPARGFIVLSEVSITYVDEVSKETLHVRLEDPTVFATWEAIDERRWLVGDDYGNLYFVMLLLDGFNEDEVQGFKIERIGQASRASVLTYLGNGYVYVGSHSGDSQIIRLGEGSIEIVQVLSNIAPILDFTVMDMGSRDEGQTNEYSSGQARIVTGSGAYQDGSLRSIRSGVGLEEIGNLGEMPLVTDIFSLRSKPDSDHSDVLVVSFINETRLFTFQPDGEVEEVETFQGLLTSDGTLLAKNVPGYRLLHCTKSSLRLLDCESSIVLGEWSPQAGTITAVSASDSHVAITVGGTEVVIFEISEGLSALSRKIYGADKQVSCINIPAMTSGICIVGFWQTPQISLLKLQDLSEIQSTTISNDSSAVPRSVLLSQVLPHEKPTLFVAAADGNVVTFSFDTSDFTLRDRKSVVLGTQQANLKSLPKADGLYNVFAMCEHPSLVYASEGRIIYGAINVDKASCVCELDSEAYPQAVAIATPEGLKIATVDTERTTHVQTLHVGETVRRIAYSSTFKAFGIGSVKRTLEKGVESVQSRFYIADEVVFQELDSFEFNENEIVESAIRAELGGVERFIVGTAYIDEEEGDAIRGRMIIFEVTQDRSLKIVTEIDVRGACRALVILHGKIAAALMKTVSLYEFSKGSLRRTATYRTSTAPIDLSVAGDVLVIADIMKSVTVVRFEEGKAGEDDALIEQARHFQIAWGTAVACVGENAFLESDAEGNLMVLQRNVDGVTDDDRRMLEVVAEIQLGEMINRIRPVSVPATPSAIVEPKAFMATVEGSIYLFGQIRPDRQDLLMRLQAAVAEACRSPGGVPFNRFRAFRNEVRAAAEPFRFVDGELVERFLDCDPALQEEIVRGLGAGAGGSVDEIRTLVESLRRMH